MIRLDEISALAKNWSLIYTEKNTNKAEYIIRRFSLHLDMTLHKRIFQKSSDKHLEKTICSPV